MIHAIYITERVDLNVGNKSLLVVRSEQNNQQWCRVNQPQVYS